MVDITHGGWWFRWSTLNRTDKWWAGASIGTLMLAALPIGIMIGSAAHECGWHLASARANISASIPFGPFAHFVVVACILLSVVSAFCWWQFSLRQDEMFNRLQNWALGMAGGWLLALLLAWSLLTLTDMVEPPSALALFVLCLGLPSIFWFVAVRRWAS